jgi:putative oxidoreductase
MRSFMSRYDAQTYAALRIVVGFLFFWHGSQKLLGFPAGLPDGMPAVILYVGGSIELVGGALILIGLMTRPAAFLCSGHMAAAYWLAHGMNAVLPIVNHGELAVLFCFAFLFIAAHGSGIWSVDAMRSGD